MELSARLLVVVVPLLSGCEAALQPLSAPSIRDAGEADATLADGEMPSDDCKLFEPTDGFVPGGRLVGPRLFQFDIPIHGPYFMYPASSGEGPYIWRSQRFREGCIEGQITMLLGSNVFVARDPAEMTKTYATLCNRCSSAVSARWLTVRHGMMTDFPVGLETAEGDRALWCSRINPEMFEAEGSACFERSRYLVPPTLPSPKALTETIAPGQIWVMLYHDSLQARTFSDWRDLAARLVPLCGYGPWENVGTSRSLSYDDLQYRVFAGIPRFEVTPTYEPVAPLDEVCRQSGYPYSPYCMYAPEFRPALPPSFVMVYSDPLRLPEIYLRALRLPNEQTDFCPYTDGGD